MLLILWLLIVLVAVLVLLSLSTAVAFRRYHVRAEGQTRHFAFEELPMTSVIIPCKGDDGTLLENLDSVVRQEHPRIEYVLVAATEDDPARAAFVQLRQRHPQRQIKTVVAGISPVCSQQNNNQVKGVEAADPSSQVMVVMDSDGQCDPRFIAKLTAPLAEPSIGGTTGFRWYQPRWSHLPDLLRTAWNAGGFTFLVNPKTAFVWGGAMAFRRADYDRGGVAEVWAHALSDDMTISRRLRTMGLALRFVPDCIVISRDRDTLGSLVRWTNRQTLVTRFYNRWFWVAASVFHLVGNLVGWGLLAAGLVLRSAAPEGSASAANLALLVGAIWIVHFWVYGLLIVGPLDTFLRPRGIVLRAQKLLLILVAPLASLLQGLNSLNSLRTRRITWAGVTYQIDDARSMKVV